jgi:hypothetical protein
VSTRTDSHLKDAVMRERKCGLRSVRPSPIQKGAAPEVIVSAYVIVSTMA